MAIAQYDDKNKKAPVKKKRVWIVVVVLGVLILAAPFIIQLTANWYAEKKLVEFIDSAGLNVEVSWSKVRASIFTRKVDIYDLSILVDHASTIESTKVTVSGYKGGSPLPYQVRVAFNGLTIPVIEPLFERSYGPLTRMGYDHLKGGLTITVGLSGDKVLTFEVVDSSFDNIGSFNGILQVQDVTETSLGAILANIKSKPVIYARGFFTEGGITTNLISLFAEDTGAEPDMAKIRILNGLNQTMHTQFKTDSEQRRSLAQLYRYFDNPHILSAQVLTDNQVLLGDLIPPIEQVGWRNTTAWFSNLPLRVVRN